MAMALKQISDRELISSFEKGEVMEVRRLARKHTLTAINTLVKLMKAPKTPAGVKRQCAKDLLDQAWGRTESRPETGEHKSGGLVVNIMRLSTGVMEQIVAPTTTEMVDVTEAIDVAKMIQAETEKESE
jgi:hypothetical protein